MTRLLSIVSIVVFCATVFTGCSASTTTLTAQISNPETGDVEELAYSNVFDGKAMIVPEKIGLYMLAEMEEKKISSMYKLRQSAGMLGPDDIGAKAELLFVFYNTTGNPLEVSLNRVVAAANLMLDEPVKLVLPAGEPVNYRVGRLFTSWYKTDLPIEFSFTFTGKSGGGTLFLERRTVDGLAELRKRLTVVQ